MIFFWVKELSIKWFGSTTRAFFQYKSLKTRQTNLHVTRQLFVVLLDFQRVRNKWNAIWKLEACLCYKVQSDRKVCEAFLCSFFVVTKEIYVVIGDCVAN